MLAVTVTEGPGVVEGGIGATLHYLQALIDLKRTCCGSRIRVTLIVVLLTKEKTPIAARVYHLTPQSP